MILIPDLAADSNQLEGSGLGVIDLGVETTYTFTGLLQGVAYQFRDQSSNGASGWSDWTPAVYQDLSPLVTAADLVGIAGLNDWWTSEVSVALLATDRG